MCTLTVEQQKNTNTDKMEIYPPSTQLDRSKRTTCKNKTMYELILLSTLLKIRFCIFSEGL